MSSAPFAAALLESTLTAHAAGLALCLRQRLGPSAAEALGTFGELSADARVRLQYLVEALALERPALYLQHVEWLRAAFAARGAGEEFLAVSLACLRATLREGLPPAALAPVEELLAVEERQLAEPWRAPPSALDGPHGARVGELLELVLDGRRHAVLELARVLARELGEEEFVLGVLARVQHELGRLWQRGEIHVAEEHYGSRLCEEILARFSAADPAPAARGARVVVAAGPGDLHDLGGRMIARQLERAGFEVFFLGANVPRVDLVLSLGDLRPALLALSVTLALHVRGAAEVIADAHGLEPRVPVLVGGAPFREVPDLWTKIGADAQAADAREAEREARRLSATPAG